ncbi:hypothetical protein PG984_005170 [Apiospora sp. TS-2023a]
MATAPNVAPPPIDESLLGPSYGGCIGSIPLPNLPSQAGPALAAVDQWPFDITVALDLLQSRPNPQVDLGTVNILRPFVVTDAWDSFDRVIFVSDSFLDLTGYDRDEVLGSNCRFLQSPDGCVAPNAPRRSISSATAYLLKQKVGDRCESSHSIINFKKSGEAFMNHLALVPIPWGAAAAAPRFVFGFANVFDDYAFATAVCQSSLDASSRFLRGQIPPVQSAPGWQALSEDVVTDPQPVEGAIPAETCASTSCVGTHQNADLLSGITSWEKSLLDNLDVLVQVVSTGGFIAYASASHNELGYSPSELVGKSIDGLYHPSDVAMLTKELKSPGTADWHLTLRLKRRLGRYEWHQTTGSGRNDGSGQPWITLTLLQHPIGSISSRYLREDSSSNHHDIWMKLSTTGLILHLFDNPQKALGLAAEDLVGTRLQELLPQNEARAEFETLLGDARQGEVTSAALALTSGRGHRLEANVVLHPGPKGDRQRPYCILARCGIVRPYSKRRKEPPPGDKKHDATAEVSSRSSEDEGNDNVLEDLDPDRCGPLGYEIHQLDVANQGLRAEMQELLKRASQRRRVKKHGDDPGGVPTAIPRCRLSGGAGLVGSATSAIDVD